MQTVTQPTSIIYEWPGLGEWTYDDYRRLPEDGRFYEIIGTCRVDIYTLHSDGIYVPFGHFEQNSLVQSNLLTNLQIPLQEICR